MSWIWKLNLQKKDRILFRLAYHNSVPTLSMFHHHHIKSSPLCNQCDDDNETFLHCVRECIHSRNLRLYLGSLLPTFLQLSRIANPHLNLIVAGVWWAWRSRNSMCLAHENIPILRLSLVACTMPETFYSCIHSSHNGSSKDRHVKWNF